MILPTKHISIQSSLLGVSATLLQYLDRAQTVSELWERTRAIAEVATFSRFIQALVLLYSLDAVTFEDGLIRRRKRNAPHADNDAFDNGVIILRSEW